jgi:hypothetical protein
MPKFFKDILTGVDGATYDIGRIGLLTGILVFHAATFYAISIGTKFDWLNYGAGFGAILAAGGAGIGMKKDTEPK